MTPQPWPVLTLADWEDTRATVHMWTQIVGKVRLALEPMAEPLVAGAALRVRPGAHDVADARRRRAASRSSSTSSTTCSSLRTTDGDVRIVALEPRTVASFYDATMAALHELGVRVAILRPPGRGRRGDPVRRGRRAPFVRRRRGAPVLAGARPGRPRDATVPRPASSARPARSTSSGAGSISP